MIELAGSGIDLGFFAISLLALVYSLFTAYVTNRFGNRERVKEIQKIMGDLSKNFNEATKRGNKDEIKKAEEEQAKMPNLLMESMILQFKPLIFSLPLLIILPMILRSLFPVFEITLPFSLPIFIQNFDKFPNWRNVFGAVGWFWVVLLFGGFAMQMIAQQSGFGKKEKKKVIVHATSKE
ncbi:MAG: EMC3/TMCO1 family protein [Candidatus Micrarchaeota archaeon]